MTPKAVVWVLDQLNKRDEQTPRMWSIDNQTLQQHTGNLLLCNILFAFHKQIQQDTAKVMCMTIRIAQLVRNGTQEQITTLQVERDVSPLHAK